MNTTPPTPPATAGPIRILIVDDNGDFRATLANYLARQPDLELAGQAASASETLRLVRKQRPDLVLLDYSMPGGNGAEVCRAIKGLPSAPKVIMVTMFEGKQFRDLSVRAGADGFITKIELCTELPPTIAKLFPPQESEITPDRPVPAGRIPE